MDKSSRFIFVLFFLSLVSLSGVFATVTDGLFYYSLDDADLTGSNPDDLTTNANDGTNSGATTGVTGQINQAFDLDGTNDRILSPSLAGTTDLTYRAFVNFDSVATRQTIGYKDGGGGVGFRLELNAGQMYINFNGAGYVNQATGFVPSTGTWYEMVVVIDGGNFIKFYVDGVLEFSYTTTDSPSTTSSVVESGSVASGGWLNGKLDEITYFNRVLTDGSCTLSSTCGGEVGELYNSGAGYNPFNSPSVLPFFEIYSQNYANHSQTYNINTFNASLSLANGSTYTFSTTTGNITTSLNESINANITISSFMANSYINQTYLNKNLSFSPLIFNYSVVNITAEDGLTGGEITEFNITLNGGTSQSVNNSILIYTDPANYTLSGVAEGYNLRNFSLNTTTNASDYSLVLFGLNSVLINIYNASDSVKISQSATVLLEATNYTQSNTTSDGDIFIQGLEPKEYSVLITSNGFQNGVYTVTVGQNTFQTLNVYLAEDFDTDVTFSFIDKNTGAILEGVSFDVEQFINTSYTLINSLTSDISGRVQTGYVEGARYRYTADLSSYEVKQFILDPVIFSSYTVRLEKNTSNDNLEQNAGVGIVYTPTVYYDETLHNFSITFSSPTGDFLYYNYTATVSSNGNIISGNGANAFGGTLEGIINITDATIYDRVTLSYRYVKSDGADYTQTRTFLISNSADDVFSFLDNAGNPFGLSLFDRIIILVVSVLLGSGVAYWFGGFAGSSIVGLLIFGYFGAVGIVPMWAVWVPITLGAILFIWGAGK